MSIWYVKYLQMNLLKWITQCYITVRIAAIKYYLRRGYTMRHSRIQRAWMKYKQLTEYYETKEYPDSHQRKGWINKIIFGRVLKTWFRFPSLLLSYLFFIFLF